MKTVVLLVFGLALCRSGFAQWAVFDIANLQQSVTNYATMVEQLAKQGEQVANQVQQIQQMEDQLKRMGNMADIKAVIGFPALKLDLNLPTKIRVWATDIVGGQEIFGDTRDGVFRPVAAEFADFDGAAVARAPEIYKRAEEITAKVDEFKSVQADVYARRDELKKAIAQTSDALQAAETEAEEQKLEAILSAEFNQLAALDSEVALGAAEIQVRAAESTAMTAAQNDADAEVRRTLAREEATKIGATFKPAYQSVLLYVKEQPFQR